MAKTNSLQEAFNLWEASSSSKSWEDGKPEEKNPHPAPEPKKEKPYKKPETVVLSKDTPSGWNTLESEVSQVPGSDKDKDVMQLQQMQDTLHKLEEELMSLELEGEMEEGMITPDAGPSGYGFSAYAPFGGTVMQPPSGYERNTCPDPPAPEEGGGMPGLDVSDTIIAPKDFVPKEGVHKRLTEHISRMEKARRAKLL